MLTITVHGMNNIEKYKITLLHLAGLFFQWRILIYTETVAVNVPVLSVV